VFCEDVAGQCICGADPICGGAHCVSSEIYPVPIVDGPGAPGVARHECADDGTLMLSIVLTGRPVACSESIGEARLRITIGSYRAAELFYVIDDVDTFAWDDADTAATGGHFILSDESGGVLSGEYDLVFGDYALVGSFEDLPVCPLPTPCE
jgi:hypothetical protein